MEQKFTFVTFLPEKRTTFSDIPLLPEIFRWKDPKRRVPFTHFPIGFSGNVL